MIQDSTLKLLNLERPQHIQRVFNTFEQFPATVAFNVQTPEELETLNYICGLELALHESAAHPTDARAMEVVEALDRQCDNMAFVINHVSLHGWYDKFLQELEEDRKVLATARQFRGK